MCKNVFIVRTVTLGIFSKKVGGEIYHVIGGQLTLEVYDGIRISHLLENI